MIFDMEALKVSFHITIFFNDVNCFNFHLKEF